MNATSRLLTASKLSRKAIYFSSAIVMMVFVSAPLMGTASAGQLTERKITLSTSEAGVAANADVSFKPTVTTNILGIVVDFCENSPLIDTACTQPTNMVTPADAATVNVSHNGQNNVGFTVHASSDQTGRVLLTHGTGLTTVSTGAAVTLTIPITNTTDTGSFYARILTYSSGAGASGYLPADSDNGAAPLDYGGVAMSTSEQLSVTARVQEVLQFCVGSTIAVDGDTDEECDDISGTSIDLGVVDSTSTAATGDRAGLAMVRTNAVNGVTIRYFASNGLRVGSTVCTGTVFDACFNDSAAESAISTGTEEFGMTITDVSEEGVTTNQLVRDANYNNDVGYAWQANGSIVDLATSASVVDDEVLDLKFAATASATTPTGAYSTTATFIATATF